MPPFRRPVFERRPARRHAGRRRAGRPGGGGRHLPHLGSVPTPPAEESCCRPRGSGEGLRAGERRGSADRASRGGLRPAVGARPSRPGARGPRRRAPDDLEGAIELLRNPLEWIDPGSDPGLYAVARYNLICALSPTGRFEEAQALLPEVRDLFRAVLLAAFEAREIHRESTAVLILFHRACEEDRLTADLARQLGSLLRKGRG